MQTITDFLKNNEAAITDFCFNAGYALSAVVLSVIVLFFSYLYMKKRYGFNVKKSFGYLCKDILSYFLTVALVYFAFALGIKTGLSDSAFLFDTMSVYVYALVIIPIFFVVSFFAVLAVGIFEKFLQRGRFHDGFKSTDISDITAGTSGDVCNDTAVSDD